MGLNIIYTKNIMKNIIQVDKRNKKNNKNFIMSKID